MVVAFLPCRAGSERVVKKNTRPFGPAGESLFEIKLTHLLESKLIDQVVVSTNDQDIIDLAKVAGDQRVKIDLRPDELCSSSTSTDQLVEYVPSILDNDCHVLWTHVTSPFLTSHAYDKLITKYFYALSENDSLMTVTKHQTFLWDNLRPINYDRSVEKWPRTQSLKVIYEVNSAAFLAHISTYIEKKDRIGDKPYLYVLDSKECIDVDWPDEFELASMMYRSSLS